MIFNLVSAVVVLMVIACSSVSAQNTPSPSMEEFEANYEATKDIGRHQLFQGKYHFINLHGQDSWSEALFKIDTKTGELFVCSGNQLDGKLFGKPDKVIQTQKCIPFEHEIEFPKESFKK
ncbi:MAG: hypothetical protein AAGU11_17830 [Syntrophobacteraceae bacterium]